jgi:hypothetical protein
VDILQVLDEAIKPKQQLGSLEFWFFDRCMVGAWLSEADHQVLSIF